MSALPVACGSDAAASIGGAAFGRRGRLRRGRAALFAAACGLVLWLAVGPKTGLRCYTVPREFSGGSRTWTLREDKVLGAGAYGSVYECVDESGTPHAVKVIPMWRMQLDNNRDNLRAVLENEVEVHEHLGSHENIVSLVDHINVKGDVGDWPRWKMVVMEIAKGGELSDLIKESGRISEEKAKHVFKQVVAGVGHLHSKRVIHRDLKTDNILICTDSTTDADKPAVKLIDFGAGHWAKEGPVEAVKCIGTLETMAPEVILARGDAFDISDPSQVDSVQEAEFRTRPFGIRRYAPGPNGKGARVAEIVQEERYPKDPLGQAWKKGVEVGWVVKSVGGVDVTDMAFDDILDMMGDRLLDNSSRGAFDGSFAVTGDNKGKGKVLPKVQMIDLPATIQYVKLKAKPYNVKADIWSLGVVLYNMVTGEMPFAATDEAIMDGKYTPPQGVSAELVDLLSKMLVVNAEERASLEEVAAHPWLA